MLREIGDRFLLQGIFEWTQIAPGYNWRTFHPIMWEVEDDRMMGAVEMTVILLGVGFRVRWTYQETKEMKHLKAEIAAMREKLEDKND